MKSVVYSVFYTLALLLLAGSLSASDQPQWGEHYTRNMVSSETNLPDSFDPQTGKNIKWVAKLGNETHSTPVIARGKILIGTNNEEPRDPQQKTDLGVLMCFNEKDGNFCWQLTVPKREGDMYLDWPKSGMPSTATIEGDRVYILNNRGVVMSLDLQGQSNGQWSFDLVSSAGIYSHDGAYSSILVHGPWLYLNSCNGVDNTHRKIRSPDAPSLVVLDKATGRLVAQDNEHIGPRIFHCTWSSPSLLELNGRSLIVFCGGDGVVYAFESLPVITNVITLASATNTVQSLKYVWKFDCDPTSPKTNVHQYTSNRKQGPSNIKSVPVIYKNRVYVTVGGDLWWGKNEAYLKCIDASLTGDITTNGLKWSYPLVNHCMASPAIANGLVFVGDCGKKIHCVDAETGKPYWTHDTKGEMWASPLVADGKAYFATRRGEVLVFAAAKEKNLLSSIELGSPISATPVAANGVLYIATMSRLYALMK